MLIICQEFFLGYKNNWTPLNQPANQLLVTYLKYKKRGRFDEMTQLANSPAWLHTRARAYANVNVQSEYKWPFPDVVSHVLSTL